MEVKHPLLRIQQATVISISQNTDSPPSTACSLGLSHKANRVMNYQTSLECALELSPPTTHLPPALHHLQTLLGLELQALCPPALFKTEAPPALKPPSPPCLLEGALSPFPLQSLQPTGAHYELGRVERVRMNGKEVCLGRWQGRQGVAGR